MEIRECHYGCQGFFRNLPDRWRFSYRQAYQHWLVSRTLQTNRSLSYLTQRQRSLPPFCWKEIARPSASRLCRYRGRRRWEPPSQNNRGSLLQRQGCRGVGRRWTKVDAQSSTSFTENLLQPFLGHFPPRICTKFRKSGGWGAEILIYWVILASCRQFHGIDCSKNCGKFAVAEMENLWILSNSKTICECSFNSRDEPCWNLCNNLFLCELFKRWAA